MTGAGVAARTVAFRALRRVHDEGAWSVQAVGAALAASDLDARDRAFAANLAYETLRWEGTLDWALSHASSRPLSRIEPTVLDVLRLGAWQLLYGRQPDRAAVAATVDVAKGEIGPRVTGFVNGVLRGLARTVDRMPWPPRTTTVGRALALGYPEWIVAEADARFGERADAVLEAGNRSPGVTLRAVGDAAGLLEEVRDGGVAASPGSQAPEAVRAPGADPGRLAAVAEGRAVPQDEASMLVVRAVGAPPTADATVLDACAGPGGKATHLAQLGWTVAAGDARPARARLVARLAERTGLAGRVLVLVADATAPPLPEAAFDAALVDAPCTGLGTVRRRPELRWRRTVGDVARLADLQLAILARTAPLVRPGGRLVYSVCTWTAEETDGVIRRALAVAGDVLAPGDAAAALGGAGAPTAHGVQLDPDHDGTDGMYVAVLERR